ncbi:MAG: CCA tRNA nucleotidyltransferase [Methanobacterium sp.]
MTNIDYKKILEEIKPSKSEINNVKSLSNKLICILNQFAMDENINAETVLVGSVAKNTWFGKADIDLFIKFPLNTSPNYLKEKGLRLGYECIKRMNGEYECRYASHPYITGLIDDYEIDFVPCYDIKHSGELKSAVDRTIPHTKYIKKNLNPKQADEVILLKRFMKSIGTYGSEFKVSGFAGYLCELLILYYNSFEQVLKSASTEWKPGYYIDLMDYDTISLFNEPLIVVDPVDKNRNVAAAVSLQKMSEFVAASRNFLKEPSASYFDSKEVNVDLNIIKNEFTKRGTKTLLLTFKTPDVPIDALYPQIKKTENSIINLMERKGFKIFGSDSWSDDAELVIILLEFSVWKLPEIKKHLGPQLWFKDYQEKYLKKYKDKVWIEGDRWVAAVERDYPKAEFLLKVSLTNVKIGYLRFGKHIKNEILKEHKLTDLIKFLESNEINEDILKFLHTYLNKNEVLWR